MPRIKGVQSRARTRWDLFLLLNASQRYKDKHLLQPIPEDTVCETYRHILSCLDSQHHCTQSKNIESGQRDTKTDNRRVEHKSRNTEKGISNRRQWETSPENLQKIYRSLSTVDLGHLEHSKKTINRNGHTGLPPLKASASKHGSKTHTMSKEHVNRDFQTLHVSAKGIYRKLSDESGVCKDDDEQWVVVKPPRRKPVDQLRLEGSLDMTTTSRTSYDKAAKDIMDDIIYRKKNGVEGEPMSRNHVDVIGHVLPPSPPGRKNRNRPRTALRMGGQGDYRTVNSKVFKRFIVVDANQNVKLPAIGNVVNGAANGVAPSGVQNGRNDAKTAGQNQNEVNGRSVRQKRSTEFESQEQEVVKEKGDILYVDVESNKASSVREPEKEQGSDKMVEKPVTDCERISASANRNRKSARTRHQSLPRSHVRKHKNDSQLRFDGDIDFETTSRHSYRNARDPTPASLGLQPPLRRDLFRASTEVDLFQRHEPRAKMDMKTTYSTQFQDKSHCPAVDLDTGRSCYRFKQETGGHKFYSPVNSG
ncbi:hypothetical protein HDE_03393 [Halotydeus destructor]|nr:hypothetical protein HDE_03393 [Halotydeus destructor]